MFRLFVDSNNGVSICPEWDYSRTDQKVEHSEMSKAGLSEVYKYGDYVGRRLTVRYVSSSTAAIVNSWWASNTPLLFMREGTTDASTVVLANNKTPIGKLAEPYSDQFDGTIELEGY